MNTQQRTELLIRLDEKTANIWRVIKEQENSMDDKLDKIILHQEKQNGKIMKNRIAIVGLICFLTGLGILEWSDVIHIFGG